MPENEADLARRVVHLERTLRLVLVAAALASIFGVLVLWSVLGNSAASAAATAPKVLDVLNVRMLNIVDQNGTTRVKIGAPLPNAVVKGRQLTRGGKAEDTMSGILLFDAEGVERSGYATVDRGYSNVLLTLDDKNRQHAMFIAEPTGATTLRLFNADSKDRVDLAIDNGGPSLSMIRRGKEIYRFPADQQ